MPKWGPGFQNIDSKLYRAEYAGLFLAVLAYLVWRGMGLAAGLAATYWTSVVFWLIFPDIVAFTAIGAFSRSKQWPAWGPTLYNTVHSGVVWGVAFAATWLLFQPTYWPILAWLAHIGADRAVGYYLRRREPSTVETSL